MRQFFRNQRSDHLWRHPVSRYLSALLALTLALLLTVRIAQAACGGGNLSDLCSSNFGLSGNLSAVDSPTGNSFPAVDNSQLPMAGALFYADTKH
ncbi:MAG: hypothetical protein IPM07_28665 [Anaerolineales bacterium]|nr:hypothetical protein [Anaerolineales bacterium]